MNKLCCTVCAHTRRTHDKIYYTRPCVYGEIDNNNTAMERGYARAESIHTHTRARASRLDGYVSVCRMMIKLVSIYIERVVSFLRAACCCWYCCWRWWWFVALCTSAPYSLATHTLFVSLDYSELPLKWTIFSSLPFLFYYFNLFRFVRSVCVSVSRLLCSETPPIPVHKKWRIK